MLPCIIVFHNLFQKMFISLKIKSIFGITLYILNLHNSEKEKMKRFEIIIYYILININVTIKKYC